MRRFTLRNVDYSTHQRFTLLLVHAS